MTDTRQEPLPLLAAFLLDALSDLERALEGVAATEAGERLEHLSSISWTVAHLAQHIDSWVLGALAGEPRNTYLAGAEFSRGGTGEVVAAGPIEGATAEVLTRARRFLQQVTAADLAQLSPYQGSIESLQGKPVNGNYRLARLIAHIYYHVGDINAVRSVSGDTVQDFPGLLLTSLSAMTRP